VIGDIITNKDYIPNRGGVKGVGRPTLSHTGTERIWDKTARFRETSICCLLAVIKVTWSSV
jgi:hypothetical protein